MCKYQPKGAVHARFREELFRRHAGATKPDLTKWAARAPFMALECCRVSCAWSQPACNAMAGDATFRKQVRELQAKLDQALREKDDLVRDLENMCLSDSTTTFNTSSVLQERIYSTGKAGGGSELQCRQHVTDRGS